MILTLDWTIKWIIFLAIPTLAITLYVIGNSKKTYFSKAKYYEWLLERLPHEKDEIISYHDDSHWAHFLDGKQVKRGKIGDKEILKEWRIKK